jgi:hypothetical protein
VTTRFFKVLKFHNLNYLIKMTEVEQTRAQKDEAVAAQSVFKNYLETHPDALQPLFRAMTCLYTDPQKESETKQ